MSTRNQLVAEAGRRLGDQTATFLTDLDGSFDFVLRDLASKEAIAHLRRESATFNVTVGITAYNTRTITGLVAPHYPLFIEQLRVAAWGDQQIIPFLNEEQFNLARIRYGTAQGRWQGWRIYPNESQLEVVPAADANAATATAVITYMRPVTVIAGAAELEEVRDEFHETVVLGLCARHAPAKDETQTGEQTYLALYELGVRKMWGHRHNSRGGRINPTSF